MEQTSQSDGKGLTFKRILICLSIIGAVIYLADRVAETKRGEARASCLARFHNVNKALVLYRADSDGFSPVYVMRELNHPDPKLGAYEGGKVVACPYDARFSILSLRLSSGGVVGTVPYLGSRTTSLYSMFGIEDSSVIATCENHLKRKFRISVPGISPKRNYMAPAIGGSYIALLRNGSAKLVPYNASWQQWLCKGGIFVLPKDQPQPWTGFSSVSVFDFEPQPPHFER